MSLSYRHSLFKGFDLGIFNCLMVLMCTYTILFVNLAQYSINCININVTK